MEIDEERFEAALKLRDEGKLDEAAAILSEIAAANQRRAQQRS